MSKVVKHTDVVFTAINYSKPVNQNNIYYSAINYNSEPCYIQTPTLIFKEIIEDSSKQTFIVLSVDKNDFSLYDLLVKLDDHNLSTTYSSSNEWFNKELPMDILEGMYRRLTEPFKKNETPTIKFKLPFHNKKLQSKIFDSENNTIDYTTLTPGTPLLCIIHIKGLKFLKKDYYCDNYVSQLKVCLSQNLLIPEKCLIETDESECNVYDYEILDEEVISNTKEKHALHAKVKSLEAKIISDQQELSILQRKIYNLT